ncbi:acyl-CoA-like ligand-binding transcription factor [Nocardiopsis coralliicola]
MGEVNGLRERKRDRAMRRIREVALELFEEEGFDAVTVERIAQAAEVSPSSVYRYFQTKEGIVLWNPNRDAALGRLFAAEYAGLPLLETLRRGLAAYFADPGVWSEGPERRRVRLLLSVPSVQAAAVRRLTEAVDSLAEQIAARGGDAAEPFRTRIAAGALLGGVLSAVRVWQEEGGTEPLPALLDRTLATLEQGFDAV